MKIVNTIAISLLALCTVQIGCQDANEVIVDGNPALNTALMNVISKHLVKPDWDLTEIDWGKTNKFGDTTLIVAARDNPVAVKELLHLINHERSTEDAIKIINHQALGHQNYSALMYAIGTQVDPNRKGTIKEYQDAMYELILAGADNNAKNTYGQSADHLLKVVLKEAAKNPTSQFYLKDREERLQLLKAETRYLQAFTDKADR